MRGRDAFVIALLALGASNARAVGLTLNWGGCVGAGMVTNQNFDCANLGGPYVLVMNIQPPSYPTVHAIDLVLDLRTSGTIVSPFWHFEGGGCNESGLAISADRATIPNTNCVATFTGLTGSLVSSYITDYAPGFGGSNKVRMLITVARGASSGILTTGGINYYLSHLIFTTGNATEAAGPCEGCRDGVLIAWSSATLHSFSVPDTTLTGAGLGSNFVTINDFSSPTELAMFEAGWIGDRVEIRWRFADGASIARVALERAGNEQGPWTTIDAVTRSEGSAMVVSDSAVRADATYYYRIVTAASDGSTQTFGPIVVAPIDGTVARETGITLIAPNPTAGALRVGFALAKAGTVHLSVLDVQGREMATLARGEYPAGYFEAAWRGRVGGEDAPMGVYFVRLRTAGVTMTRRLAVAR